MAKPSVTLRSGKGSALTYSELDANFTNLKDATVTLKAGTGGTDVSGDLNSTITLVAGSNVTLTGDNTAKTITIASSGGGGGLANVVEDTTPQLGGNLDCNDFGFITGTGTDRNIIIEPDGSGRVGLRATTIEIGKENSNVQITTLGTGDLRLNTNAGTGANTGEIRIYDGTNGNITITPHGIGNLVLDGLNWPQSDGDADQVLKTSGTGQLGWANAVVGLSDVVNDTTPQLGGSLDVNGNSIYDSLGTLNLYGGTTASTSTGASVTLYHGTNANVDIRASGTGWIDIGHTINSAVNIPGFLSLSDGSSYGSITTASADSLILTTNLNSSSGQIKINSGANGNIEITPNGTGKIVLDGLSWPNADGTANQILKTNGSGVLSWATASSGPSIAWLSITSPQGTLISGTTYKISIAEEADPSGIVTVSSNTFTLDAGTYLFKMVGVLRSTGDHYIQLRENTTPSTLDNFTNSIKYKNTSNVNTYDIREFGFYYVNSASRNFEWRLVTPNADTTVTGNAAWFEIIKIA